MRAARAAGISFTLHELELPESAGTEAFPAALGVGAGRVFKTLIARIDAERFAVAVVPLDRQLDLKALAAAAGGRRAEMAEPRDAERVTGYRVGGISPLGQKRRLPTYLDAGALAFETLFVSAGRWGLELELAPAELIRACGAEPARLANAR